ncbi:lysophospholipid acyltransferase family protein [Desulfovibrio inopinatus]|uniref:lysophospholipid acyltransferase family protein n=1 Tax=Desulfovibrio inopinatus TaxID=102109 RepID=UPI00146FC829|nr:lysophospholipid acyltransferase family protein [Desulfovibrio inopinatus]
MTIRTIVLNIAHVPFLLIWTGIAIVFTPFAFILYKIIMKRTSPSAIRSIVWFYARVWIHFISLFMPIERKTGKWDDYPQPCIIVGNHQSMTDLYFMASLPIHDVAFVVRGWPFRIPFFGFYMRNAQYVDVEQYTPEGMFEHIQNLFRQKTSIMFFPEGTRHSDGHFGRFHSGAFRLSCQTGRPVVPLCFYNTGKMLPKGTTWLRITPVTVVALPPVYPHNFSGELGHIAMRKHVKLLMEKAILDIQQQYKNSERVTLPYCIGANTTRL